MFVSVTSGKLEQRMDQDAVRVLVAQFCSQLIPLRSEDPREQAFPSDSSLVGTKEFRE